MIVVDASAAVAALLTAGAARREMASEPIHVPHLIDSEIASTLRRLVAAGAISASQAWSTLRTWQQLGITRYPAVALLVRVWELRDNVSAYDATYVALAENLACRLMTADRRLARAPGITCSVTVVPN